MNSHEISPPAHLRTPLPRNYFPLGRSIEITIIDAMGAPR